MHKVPSTVSLTLVAVLSVSASVKAGSQSVAPDRPKMDDVCSVNDRSSTLESCRRAIMYANRGLAILEEARKLGLPFATGANYHSFKLAELRKLTDAYATVHFLIAHGGQIHGEMERPVGSNYVWPSAVLPKNPTEDGSGSALKAGRH